MTPNRRTFAVALAAVVLTLPCIAQALTCTWTGTVSANWSIPGNWSGCVLPSPGDSLVFPDSGSNKAMTDDIANLAVTSIGFPDSSGGYILTGAGNLTITGAAAITSKATGTNVNTLALTNAMKFGAVTATIDTSTGAKGHFNLNGPIDLNGSVLSFVWDDTVPSTTINGVISGAGGLSIDGTGGDIGLALYGDNTFTGPVRVNHGYLALHHANALGAAGSAADGTTVHGNGTLVLGTDIVNEFLTLEGGGGQSGNGQMQAGGNRTWSGPVFIDTTDGLQSNFNLLGNHINFSGVVSGPGGFYCCNEVDGTIGLGNSGNTYAGISNFINTGGTLQLLADNALSPNSAIDLSGSAGGILDMGGFSGSAAGFTGIAGAKLKIVAGQTLQSVDP